MKKILIIFGTRPEAIKLAPLINEFKKNTDFFETKICVTGQHRQMLKNIFAFFEINPDYNLDIMKKNQTLNYISSSLIKKLDQIIKSYQPDLVLVQGDTTTATIASLAAFYSNVRVGHIEAGLRTYNKLSPYPEEINRQIITKIADYHFAPTKEAQKNLKKEQIEKDKIIITGNTIIDSLRLTEKKLKNYTNDEIEKLKKIIKTNKKIILVTGHRRENLENGLNNVCEALKKLAKENKDLQIIYPVHPNPKVQKIVKNSLANTKNIKLTKPLSYPSFVWLMQRASLIITDSGGIQEEAFYLNKPLIVTRNNTKRPEAIDNNFSFLTELNPIKIAEKTHNLLNKNSTRHYNNIYGRGQASKKIINFLKNESRFL